MVSTRCFSSSDGQYLVNLYFDAELYKREDEKLVFVKNLGKLKNPYNAAFSPDGSKVLVKNNNALIEIYEISSFKKTTKTKAPKDSKYVYFLDNERLIFSTESGMLYTLDIWTSELKQHFHFDGLVDANLYYSINNDFLFTVFDELKKETHIYQIKSDTKDLSINILSKVNGRILEDGIVETQSDLYFVTSDGALCYAPKNHNESLSHHKIIYELTNTQTLKTLAECFWDLIEELFIKTNTMLGGIIFKGALIYKNHLLVALVGGFLIFRLDTLELIRMIPSKVGIDSIHFVRENRMVIICNGFNTISCLFDDLVEGIFAPYLL